MTKSRMVASLSDLTGFPNNDVTAMLEDPGLIIEHHIRKRAVGAFTLPGILEIRRARNPARKARTREEIDVSATPALTAVKVQPLAGLIRMVEQAVPLRLRGPAQALRARSP